MVPKARILIVEDDGVTALNIRARLCQAGYAVLAIAESAQQAIDYVEIAQASEQIDLVLMDIQLKGDQDGITTAETIQGQFNIPVVYLTANADHETIDRAKLTQPYGYVIKPFQNADLLSVLEIALYKHKLDQQLREREQWLAATLKSIGDAVITTDAAGKITFMNPLAEELTACVRHSCNDQMLTEVLDLADAQTSLPCEDIVAQTLAKGISVSSQQHVLLNNRAGERIPIEYQISPILNGRNEITGSVLVFRDVSDRLAAEMALQQNEERYRILYKATPVMMYSIDRNLEIIDISDHCLKKLGYGREEMIGRKSVDFLTKDSRRCALEVRLPSFFKTGILEDVPLQFIRKDGSIMDVLLSAIMERDADGNMIRTLTVLNDITDRLKSERALRLSEAKFRRLVEADVIGVIVGNVEGTVSYVNDYFLNMLGYDRTEFESGQINWREITSPDDLHIDDEVINDLNLGKSCSYEKEYVHKDGRRVPVLIGATKLDGYQIDTGIGFVLDLSERNRTAQELHDLNKQLYDLNQQLEQKVEERTADLQQLNARLVVEVTERRKAEQSLTEYLNKLSSFQATLFKISCADSLTDIYDIAIASVNQFLGTSRAALLLTNQEHTQVYFAAAQGISDRYRRTVGQTLSESGYISSDKVALYADVNESVALKSIRALLNQEGIGAIASFPLKYQEKLMGRLVTYYEQPHGFSDEDINLASALATSLAVAISRQQAEIARRDREQQYRSLVANIPGVIYRVLPDLNFTPQFVSDGIQTLLGYTSDEITTPPRSFVDLTHPEDLPRITEQVNQAIALAQPFELEYRLIAANGEIKHVYEKGQGIFDPNGELAYIDGAIFDVSDRKALESEHQLYAERLHNLYQTVFEFGRAQNLAQLYDIALLGIKQTLNCDRVAILTLGDHQRWQILLSEGLSSKHCHQIEVCLNSPSDSVCANGDGFGVKTYADIQQSPLPQPLQESSQADGIASLGVAWIKYQDRAEGQIAFYYDQPHQFSDQEIELVDTLATYIGIAITRKRAERALWQSEAKYRSLVGNISGAIYRSSMNEGWKTEFMSEAIEDICGYGPAYFTEANGHSFLELIHLDDRPKVHQKIQAALAQGIPYELEYRIIDAKGRERWVSDRGTGIYNQDGVYQYEDGVIFDISARKEIEAELHRSKATQQAIIDAIPDLLVTIHRDGTYLGIMSGGEVKLINADQVLGQNIHNTTPPDFAKERLRHVELAITSRKLQVYEYQVEVEGKIYDEEARIVPCGTDEALIMVRNITDRKQAERALQYSEAKYRVLFNSIGDPVFVHGHNRQVPTAFTEVNDLACDSLGYSREELYGMTVKDIMPPDFKYDPEAITAFLRDREAIFKVEHVHKDQHRFPVEVRARIFEFDGEVMVVGIARDVSEHKQIEAELRRAYEQQKELAELRSKFIAMVSHEFRTPMSTILLSIDLLQHKSMDWHEEKKQLRFERIRQGITRIDSLIENMLVMGKTNAGQMKFQPAPMDLLDLCVGIAEEAQISTNRHQVLLVMPGLAAGITINAWHDYIENPNQVLLPGAIDPKQFNAKYRQLLEHTTNAYMDEKLLQHILTNLLSNAIKYSPQGGNIELSIAFEPIAAEVRAALAPIGNNGNHHSADQIEPQDLEDRAIYEPNGQGQPKLPNSNGKLSDELIGQEQLKPSPRLKVIGKVTLMVRDAGVGIEPEDKLLLFNEFHRGSNVSNTPGTGLGLAIVKRAVDLHGGKILVDSQVGDGTTFTVKLPVFAAAESAVLSGNVAQL
jgi:PAS domain S-box-containing protein